MPLLRLPKNGFTLIEIIIAVGIAIIITTLLMQLFVFGAKFSRTAFLQEQAIASARLQLKRLSADLRNTQQSDAGDYPLERTEPQRLVFFSDIDDDSDIERVRYELVGNTFIKGVVEPSATAPVTYDMATEKITVASSLVRNGTEPVFIYYDGNYPANTTPLSPARLQDAKYIQTHLVIDADPQQKPNAIDLTTQVQLRSLKTNLGEPAPT